MTLDPAGPVARRFPLIARPRPACIPLGTRVSNLCALARSAERDGSQASASAVFNQAALLASDIGLPDLARQWCLQHAGIYLRARPLDARAARHALEPLVNLARLHIRDGDGDTAFCLLDTLYEAVTTRTDTVVGGIPLPAATLTAYPGDHQELGKWLWAVHLGDGTRALTSAGRWHDAHAHLLRRNGIGRRMLDGRQVAVITLATAGDTDGALALLGDTAPGDPWENAVTACLTVLCRRSASHPADRDLAAMLDRYQKLDPAPALAVFSTRLGLSVIDAATGLDDAAAHRVATDLIHRTTAVRDGYAARDVLAHTGCASALTERQAHDLAGVIDASALGHRTIPAHLRADLSAALHTSEAVLVRTLTTRLANADPRR
jgi:hypothetical protein